MKTKITENNNIFLKVDTHSMISKYRIQLKRASSSLEK